LFSGRNIDLKEQWRISHQENPAQKAGSVFSFRAASGKTLDIASMVKRLNIESQEWYLSVLTNNVNAAHYFDLSRFFSCQPWRDVLEPAPIIRGGGSLIGRG